MIKNIFLVRHGESLGNVDKSVHRTTADHAIPLSDKGHNQAMSSAVALRYVLHSYSIEETAAGIVYTSSTERESNFGRVLQPTRIWSSPYERARQTAGHIGGKLNLPVREDVLLAEQQFGLFDGLEVEVLAETFPLEYAHYKKCEDFQGRFWAPMPLGESRYQVAQRVRQFFPTIQRDGVENLVIVAHGTTIRAFVMQWLHLSPEWFEAEKNPGNGSIRWIRGNEDKGYIYEAD